MSSPADDDGTPDLQLDRVIIVGESNLLEICERIEAAFVANDAELLQDRGTILWKSPHGLVKADAALLRLRAMRIATFMKVNRRIRRLEILDPELKYFTALLRKGEWKFPHLDESAR